MPDKALARDYREASPVVREDCPSCGVAMFWCSMHHERSCAHVWALAWAGVTPDALRQTRPRMIPYHVGRTPLVALVVEIPAGVLCVPTGLACN